MNALMYNNDHDTKMAMVFQYPNNLQSQPQTLSKKVYFRGISELVISLMSNLM